MKPHYLAVPNPKEDTSSSDEEDRQGCASIIHEVVINDKNPFRK